MNKPDTVDELIRNLQFGGHYAEAGFTVFESDLIGFGRPLIVEASTGLVERPEVWVHPLDRCWLAYPNDPYRADYYAQKWIQKRIDKLADEACARLDNMYPETRVHHYKRERDDRNYGVV